MEVMGHYRIILALRAGGASSSCPSGDRGIEPNERLDGEKHSNNPSPTTPVFNLLDKRHCARLIPGVALDQEIGPQYRRNRNNLGGI